MGLVKKVFTIYAQPNCGICCGCCNPGTLLLCIRFEAP